LAAYGTHPGLFEAAVICDLDRERAAGLAVEAPGCRVSTSLDDGRALDLRQIANGVA